MRIICSRLMLLALLAVVVTGCQQTPKQKADAQAKAQADAQAKQEQQQSQQAQQQAKQEQQEQAKTQQQQAKQAEQQAKLDKEQAKKQEQQAKKDEQKAHEEMLKQSDNWWPSEGGSWKKFANAQAAAGAQQDASLSSEHFTGGKLNTLGQEKLRLMMQGGVLPAVVYLGALDEPTLNVRRAAIDNWLKDSGSGTDALVVKSGYNPRVSTPAMEGISRMKRIESTGEEQRSPDQTSTAGQTGTSTSGGGSSGQ